MASTHTIHQPISRPVILFDDDEQGMCCCVCGAHANVFYNAYQAIWLCRDIETCELNTQDDEAAVLACYGYEAA